MLLGNVAQEYSGSDKGESIKCESKKNQMKKKQHKDIRTTGDVSVQDVIHSF